MFGGGGSRGAMQVGALRALLEANIVPDILVGTSIGACNAAFLATNGMNEKSLEKLTEIWHKASASDLLPTNFIRLSARMLFKRNNGSKNHFQKFLVLNGLTPELRFRDLIDIQLYMVATDINNARLTCFGTDPEASILDSVIASSTIPPWVTPQKTGDQLFIDGGFVSNVPIQVASDAGASEIIAFELADNTSLATNNQGLVKYMGKIVDTVQKRLADLEYSITQERNQIVCRVPLKSLETVPIWDFSHTDSLIEQGYQITKQEIDRWQAERQTILQ